ncbi:MAG: hypothetical protein LC742_10590, partial [Acidobacteria bacterium]|nr:hypothetical protein [Acidobacteriota bacterium]
MGKKRAGHPVEIAQDCPALIAIDLAAHTRCHLVQLSESYFFLLDDGVTAFTALLKTSPAPDTTLTTVRFVVATTPLRAAADFLPAALLCARSAGVTFFAVDFLVPPAFLLVDFLPPDFLLAFFVLPLREELESFCAFLVAINPLSFCLSVSGCSVRLTLIVSLFA